MLKSRRDRFQTVTPGVQTQWIYIPSPKFLGITQIRNTYTADSDTAITSGVEEKFRVFKFRDADKSLARPGRKQATGTEDFEFHISYL